MSEIKFRAKSKQDYETSIDGIQKGDWVYGYYYFCRSRMCGVIKTTMMQECGGIGSGIVQVDIEVDIKTLCQFTGKKDSQDKEIYGGDIIHCINGSVGIITYDPETIMYKVDSNFKTGFCHPVDGYTPPLEVIGNIYENPSLVGGTQKGEKEAK